PRLENDPLWYQDAVIYELHVRSFCDSNEDGIGDFNGLTQKLDYLQDLGINTLWLLPFCPSPLRDDGYDISKYTDVNPSYGTLKDFKNFLQEAHRRGLRVVTELVLNHTSEQHPWFQRARQAKPGSRYRNFYVWSQDPHQYKDARIIFKDFERSNWTWDPTANAYFWHRFYSHQPDLNYENPAVRKAMFEVVDFWFKTGVDGLRLDAVPYLYEEEGTNCENLPQSHEFLKSLRRHIDQKFQNRMLLAEANQWPEDAVAYFGKGKECHMAFHFPLMPRLFMAIQMENRFPVEDILEQTPTIPENCQWAIFLRNHDELTLEMVTDEERDYMYRTYAQDPQAKINLGIRRRLAPLLANNRRKIELMNGLLFSLPGTPVIYYGDEFGMGDNIYLGDRNGVRTPMQWSGDRNAGFSKANPQSLFLPVIIDPEYHYEALNVEGQQNNAHSLLWWMKRLIALRKGYKVFGRGSIEFLKPDNHKILSFIRRWKDQEILVLANLSRFIQAVKLDLRKYEGKELVELFGQTVFPRIGKLPYFITMAPHSFYWFSIERVKTDRQGPSQKRKRVPIFVEMGRSIENLLDEEVRKKIEAHLPVYLQDQRWFGSKSYKIRGVSLLDLISVSQKEFSAGLFLLKVDYFEREEEVYLLPLAFAWNQRARAIREETPQRVLAEIKNPSENSEGVIYETIEDPQFCKILLEGIVKRTRRKALNGVLQGKPLITSLGGNQGLPPSLTS
ncbi:MAG: maltose alpha-D-glucosyltransferase, partial [bacterium]|nr:maltose alpha-D-glucosyltransferase [bacterium]